MRILSFQGRYRFLSNFWPAEVIFDGEPYPTVEHAYQAAKAAKIDDRKRIQLQAKPGWAKSLGRKIAMRPDWEQVKLDVMRDLVGQKFTRNMVLREMLKDTGDAELIEGNTWGDKFWGMCNGEGENHLGRILMDVRRSL